MEQIPEVYHTARTDRRRGLQMRCPTPIAIKLRKEGWFSHAGYWWKSEAAEHGMRWWAALAVHMGESPAAPKPAAPDTRCQLTAEMFQEDAA